MDPTTEYRSRRERRKDRTRRRLIETADELFRRQGFNATTVEEIASLADVAKGTFFNYFKSKNDLPSVIISERISDLLLDPPGEELPIAERIELLLHTMWYELLPYQNFAQRMFAHLVTHPRSVPRGRHVVTPAQAIAGLIRQEQQKGVLRAEADADTVGFLITGYFFRLYILTAGEELSDEVLERRIHAMLDLIFYGLLP